MFLDAIWDAGYEFDSVFWCDDMGYKGCAFFSAEMYREFLKPAHKKLTDWAHSKKIKAHLHSCGNVMKLVPEFIGLGGFAGTGHIDAYKKNENIELIALCDTDEPWLKCAKYIKSGSCINIIWLPFLFQLYLFRA